MQFMKQLIHLITVLLRIRWMNITTEMMSSLTKNPPEKVTRSIVPIFKILLCEGCSSIHSIILNSINFNFQMY